MNILIFKAWFIRWAFLFVFSLFSTGVFAGSCFDLADASTSADNVNYSYYSDTYYQGGGNSYNWDVFYWDGYESALSALLTCVRDDAEYMSVYWNNAGYSSSSITCSHSFKYLSEEAFIPNADGYLEVDCTYQFWGVNQYGEPFIRTPHHTAVIHHSIHGIPPSLCSDRPPLNLSLLPDLPSKVCLNSCLYVPSGSPVSEPASNCLRVPFDVDSSFVGSCSSADYPFSSCSSLPGVESRLDQSIVVKDLLLSGFVDSGSLSSDLADGTFFIINKFDDQNSSFDSLNASASAVSFDQKLPENPFLPIKSSFSVPDTSLIGNQELESVQSVLDEGLNKTFETVSIETSFDDVLMNFVSGSNECTNIHIENPVGSGQFTLSCTSVNKFKSIFSFIIYAFTLFYFFITIFGIQINQRRDDEDEEDEEEEEYYRD